MAAGVGAADHSAGHVSIQRDRTFRPESGDPDGSIVRINRVDEGSTQARHVHPAPVPSSDQESQSGLALAMFRSRALAFPTDHQDAVGTLALMKMGRCFQVPALQG
jgi:hypothetical protein